MFNIEKDGDKFFIQVNGKSWYISDKYKYVISFIGLDNFTVFNKLTEEYNGVLILSGYNSILFDKEEDAKRAVEWLDSIILLDKIVSETEKNYDL